MRRIRPAALVVPLLVAAVMFLWQSRSGIPAEGTRASAGAVAGATIRGGVGAAVDADVGAINKALATMAEQVGVAQGRAAAAEKRAASTVTAVELANAARLAAESRATAAEQQLKHLIDVPAENGERAAVESSAIAQALARAMAAEAQAAQAEAKIVVLTSKLADSAQQGSAPAKAAATAPTAPQSAAGPQALLTQAVAATAPTVPQPAAGPQALLAQAVALVANSAPGRSWCMGVRRRFGVVVGQSWGTMPTAFEGNYKRLECDFAEQTAEARLQAMRLPASSGGPGAKYIDGAVADRLPAEKLSRLPDQDARVPVVAIGASVTTRGHPDPTTSTLALFQYMLPSLVRTAERGFEYWLYISFDQGDPFFAGTPDGPARQAVAAWVDQSVVAALKLRGITARFVTLGFKNPMRKPGPVMNFMMKAAFVDGADFLYRINDDTEFVDAFASSAVATLRGFTPALLGVVGPICAEGKTSILTHDFVHRTHLEIFPTYYPPVFTDWWLDDWISLVYGFTNTRRGPFTVTHHLGHAGTRYIVNHANEGALVGEVERGAELIKAWVTTYKRSGSRASP